MQFNYYKVGKRFVVNRVSNGNAHCIGSFVTEEIAKKYIEMRIKNALNNIDTTAKAMASNNNDSTFYANR